MTSVRGSQRVTSQNPGRHLSVARALRPRPDRAGEEGQARSGHRPRRRDPPCDSGAVAPHQEQSGPHRRTGRRQDRGRRRAGAADCPPGRARGAEEQADRRARHGCARGRREVSRRVRGAAEGRAEGSRRFSRTGHPVHRRAAHGRRRRRRRGIDGRLEHAQADAGPRRAAHGRCDDARRVSQVHREGCRARAALPAGHDRRADGRGHDQHPARASRALRDPSRRHVQGLGARGRGRPLEPLHRRPVPARQGDRSDRRGRVAAAHGDRLDAGRARRGVAADHAARDRARGAAQGEGQGVERAAREAGKGTRRPEGRERTGWRRTGSRRRTRFRPRES